MADKLMIIMANAEDPAVLVSAFAQATVAAAMEYETEIVFSGRSGRLAIKGQAERLAVGPERSAYDLIRDAREAGVKFKVCTAALDLFGNDLIPEIAETVGGAYIISEAMDDATVTFTY